LEAPQAERMKPDVPPGESMALRQSPPIALPHAVPDVSRQTMTICFFDVQGFTQLSNAVGEAELAANFFSEYARLAAAIIAEFSGILDKVVGDGVIGLFGPFGGE